MHFYDKSQNKQQEQQNPDTLKQSRRDDQVIKMSHGYTHKYTHI